MVLRGLKLPRGQGFCRTITASDPSCIASITLLLAAFAQLHLWSGGGECWPSICMFSTLTLLLLVVAVAICRRGLVGDPLHPEPPKPCCITPF